MKYLTDLEQGQLNHWRGTGVSASPKGKKRVNILALGDVGATVLMGLKLLGGDVIQSIGIYDIHESAMTRMEMEMNQVNFPWEYDLLPQVVPLKREDLFHCEAFIFCASMGVPPVDSNVTDVRMAQFESNRKLVSQYAEEAAKKEYKGLFAVVSDPVDLLCRQALETGNVSLSYGEEQELYSEQASEKALGQRNCGEKIYKPGLLAEQIRGYGLGVMNARAAYYAKKDERFSSFLTEGRAFGPHGKDLVIANSIEHYHEELSLELTKLAVESNIRSREAGFKPYIAPALSSAAISILQTLRGEWNYSSVLLGEVFMGCKNRMTEEGTEIEALPLPDALFHRVETAYDNLKNLFGGCHD